MHFKFTLYSCDFSLALACSSSVAVGGDTLELAHRVTAASAPKVFYTAAISPQGLDAVYSALDRTLQGKVAVKLSTGEAGNTHYLQPALIKDLVTKVNGTIVECNTAYAGARATTAMHRQLIADHGFDKIAPVDIMDEDGGMEIPVPKGDYITSDLVGKNLANYDSMLVLSHFKGHTNGGFGGALKNISIGIASAQGKLRIHNAGHSEDSFEAPYRDPRSDEHLMFIKTMAEAALAVHHYFKDGNNILYVSVMNNLSVDCDCDGNPAAPDMHDIGILASTDPVALDQACVDLVYAAPDGASLIERMESRRGPEILPHAQEIGLGQMRYQLISLD